MNCKYCSSCHSNSHEPKTIEQYDEMILEYKNRLSVVHGNEWDEVYEELSKFQQSYMENVLKDYKKTIDRKAKFYIFELMCYAVRNSESGNSIVDVELEEIANDIDSIIWEEIGDYLLDCQIYKEDEHWVIDCMFAGNYVPYWDGWADD